MKHIEAEFVDNGVFFPMHEVYWHNEPDAEEGWATEYQVGPCCKSIYALDLSKSSKVEVFTFSHSE